MKRCYIIYFTDSNIDCVTTDSIEKYAEDHGMNMFWGNGDAGTLVRKDAHDACRYFVGANLK